MSHFDDIIAEVVAHGLHEESWHILLNSYFREDDGFERITEWARSVGLTVSFSNHYQTCTFRAIDAQPMATPRALKLP